MQRYRTAAQVLLMLVVLIVGACYFPLNGNEKTEKKGPLTRAAENAKWLGSQTLELAEFRGHFYVMSRRGSDFIHSPDCRCMRTSKMNAIFDQATIKVLNDMTAENMCLKEELADCKKRLHKQPDIDGTECQ